LNVPVTITENVANVSSVNLEKYIETHKTLAGICAYIHDL